MRAATSTPLYPCRNLKYPVPLKIFSQTIPRSRIPLLALLALASFQREGLEKTVRRLADHEFCQRLMADKCDVEVILKLGGCAVTHKRNFETVKHEAIQAAAKLVKQVRGKCIVIHGAG